MSEKIHWVALDVEIARNVEPKCFAPTERERRAMAFQKMMRGEGGMSTAVTWDSRTRDFELFDESCVDELVSYLESFPVVAVFNKNFDVSVVQALAKRDIRGVEYIDPLRWVPKTDEGKFQKGSRLNNLAQWNLGREKLHAKGTDAYGMFERGEIAHLFRYNREDVAILRDLVYHVVTNRCMLGPNGLIDLSDLPPFIWDLA